MMIMPGIELPDTAIADICRVYEVRELSLFGSAARGEMGPDSDFDLLVDFSPGARPGLQTEVDDAPVLRRKIAAIRKQ